MFGLMNLLFDQGHIVLAEHRVMFHNFICLYTNVYVCITLSKGKLKEAMLFDIISCLIAMYVCFLN